MEDIIKGLDEKVKGIVSGFSAEVGGLRSNRPTPQLIEDIKIEYFNQQVPVKQLGNVAVQPPRDLVLALWDPTPIKEVAKALEDAKRGFTVSIQGSAIRITLPVLSQERRDEMVKLLGQIAEQAKIRIRMAREDANKRIEAAEKAKAITEDMRTRGKKKIQDSVDKGNGEIVAMVSKKTAEFQD